MAGTFTVARNTSVRAGVLDPDWKFGVGAIWFDGRDRPMTNTVNVTDLRLIDRSYEAIHIMGSGVSGPHFDGVGIEGAGAFALHLQATGGAGFRNVVASGIRRAGIYTCQGPNAFAIQDLGGNSGWDSTYCGPWPARVSGTPTQPPGSPPTGPPTSPPTPPATSPPTTSPPPAAPPPGWRLHVDPSGFLIGVRVGWTTARDGNRLTFRDPGSERSSASSSGPTRAWTPTTSWSCSSRPEPRGPRGTIFSGSRG